MAVSVPPDMEASTLDLPDAVRVGGVTEMVQALTADTSEFRLHGIVTPFVGRRAELDALIEVASRAGQDETLQQVRLSGLEGIGKTRLCHELRAILNDAGIAIGYLHAVTHDGTTPAVVLCAQLIRQRFGLRPGDSDETVRQRLEAALGEVFPERRVRGAAARLGSLLGLPIPRALLRKGIPHPAAFRRRALGTLARVLAHDAKDAPQILVFDRLEWLAPEDAHLIAELLNELREVPVVAIFVAPGGAASPPVLEDAARTDIRLGPLSIEALQQLCAQLMGDAPPAVVQRLRPAIEAAAGNPRRLEELLRLLVRRGALLVAAERLVINDDMLADLESGVLIPTDPAKTAQFQLSDISDAERDFLTAGAVLGAHFWIEGVVALRWADGVGAVHDLPDEDHIGAQIQRTLLDLLKRDLIRFVPHPRLADAVELAFSSRHDRDALLASIDRGTRRRLERHAARWMMHARPVDPRAWYRQAAERLDEAKLSAQAADAWRRTGEAAAAAGLHDEALQAFEQARGRLTAEDVDAQLPLSLARAEALERSGKLEESLVVWSEAYRWARVIDDRRALARSLVSQGRVLRRMGSAERAAPLLERVRKGFDRAGTLDAVAMASEQLAGMAAEEGSIGTALEHLSRAQERWQQLHLEGPVARCMVAAARLRIGLVEIEQAAHALELALPALHAIPDAPTLPVALNLLGCTQLLLGAIGPARASFKRSRDRAAALGLGADQAIAVSNLADLTGAEGRNDKAVALAREAVALADEARDDAALVLTLHRLARVLLVTGGSLDEARELAERATRRARRAHSLRLEALAVGGLAEVGSRILGRENARGQALGPKAIKEVGRDFVSAIRLAEGLEDQLLLARLLEPYAAFLEAHGAGIQGRKARLRAERILEPLGARRRDLAQSSDTLELPTLADAARVAFGAPYRGEPLYA